MLSRKKSGSGRTHRPVSISLSPDLHRRAMRRSTQCHMAFSAYIQHLIDDDLANDRIPEIFRKRAAKLEAA